MPDRIAENGGLTPDSMLAELKVMRAHVRELQLPQIVHGRRAIILLEGPAGSGKKTALRHICAAFDPCQFAVRPITFDRRQAAEGHWLARFWRALPEAGSTAIFFRSWYRRVLDDRIHGRVDDAALTRAFDEINEFEAQQRDYGTLIVKLYFDVPSDVQERRLQDRAAHPWLGVMRGEPPVRVGDPAYRQAFDELKIHTDTRWSPWRIIDATDEDEAALAALTAIGDSWARAMPAEPPRLVERSGEAA
jgi:polyphosphate kinase 2 (PPK2 family)